MSPNSSCTPQRRGAEALAFQATADDALFRRVAHCALMGEGRPCPRCCRDRTEAVAPRPMCEKWRTSCCSSVEAWGGGGRTFDVECCEGCGQQWMAELDPGRPMDCCRPVPRAMWSSARLRQASSALSRVVDSLCWKFSRDAAAPQALSNITQHPPHPLRPLQLAACTFDSPVSCASPRHFSLLPAFALSLPSVSNHPRYDFTIRITKGGLQGTTREGGECKG